MTTNESVEQGVREARIILDVFLAGYDQMPAEDIARQENRDECLTWGQLRSIRNVLATLSESRRW